MLIFIYSKYIDKYINKYINKTKCTVYITFTFQKNGVEPNNNQTNG